MVAGGDPVVADGGDDTVPAVAGGSGAVSSGEAIGASFDDAIALRRLGDGRFEASTPPSWTASGRAPGGLLEAQMLAGIDAVDADGFVLIRSRTGLVRGGYLDWDVDAWAPDGTLLCQSRQMLAVLD